MVRVLVVDRSSDVRTLVRNTLSPHGHRVNQATNFHDAWAFAAHHNVDLLLVGALEEGYPELETARRLKECFPGILLVVMVPISKQGLVPESLRIGADDVLVTPLNVQRMLEGLARLFPVFGLALSKVQTKATSPSGEDITI